MEHQQAYRAAGAGKHPANRPTEARVLNRRLLVAAAIPFVVTPPQRWRARVGLSQKAASPQSRKKAVALAACRRFPGVAIKLDHADAVMLAVAAAFEHGIR